MPESSEQHNAAAGFKLDASQKASMLSKMEARTEERDRKRAEQDEHRDPNEDAFKIHAQFKASVTGLQQMLSAAGQAKKAGAEVEELETMLSEVQTSFTTLSTDTAEKSLHLPAYDQRQMQIALKELQQTMSDTRLVCMPPTKFSFKSKRKAKKNKEAKPEAAGPSAAAPAEAPIQLDLPEQPSIRDKVGEQIYMVNEGKQDLNIANCRDCTITIRGVVGAMYISNVVNCSLWIGPVGAGMLVEKAEQCKFFVSAHQLRIHNALQTDFYCLTNSPPIIEHCKEVRFAPYVMAYDGLDADLETTGISRSASADNWNDVKDFDWLRQQHSPNWSAIPDEEREEAVAAKEC